MNTENVIPKESVNEARSGAAVRSNAGLGHAELDTKLLQSLGLSEALAKIVMDHITELRAEIKIIKRKTLLEASSEVAGHWNDRSTMTNQYQQAQRSAGVLQRQGYEIECPNAKVVAAPPEPQ